MYHPHLLEVAVELRSDGASSREARRDLAGAHHVVCGREGEDEVGNNVAI